MNHAARILAFVLVCLGACLCPGQTVRLAWDASTSTNVVNYNVYAGTNATLASTNYSVRVSAGTNLTVTVDRLKPGRWTFAATAVNLDGLESDFSTTISAEVPAPPSNMRTVILQYTGTIPSTNWQDMGLFRIKAE